MARTRAAHPRLGGLLLAISDEPRTVKSWAKGSAGERALGEALERMRESDGLGVIHDRRIPGSTANIDHIVIARAGVFVIDAKRYSGTLQARDRGRFFAHDWRLFVGGRDQTKLVDGMGKQVRAVRTVLDQASVPDCPIRPALCFVDAQVRRFESPFEIGGVGVYWPKPLYKRLRMEGPLEHRHISALEAELAAALPAA